MKKVKNHKADMSNNNEGTSGLNSTHKKNIDNKSDQLNSNNEKFKPKK